MRLEPTGSTGMRLEGPTKFAPLPLYVFDCPLGWPLDGTGILGSVMGSTDSWIAYIPGQTASYFDVAEFERRAPAIPGLVEMPDHAEFRKASWMP